MEETIERAVFGAEEDSQASLVLRKEWLQKFLAYDGYAHLLALLIDGEGFLLPKGSDDQLSSFRKSCLGLLLQIVKVFVSGAYSANDPSLYEQIEIVRRTSSIGVDESELAKKDRRQDAAKQTVQREVDARFKELV